jgi:hypothetical protein
MNSRVVRPWFTETSSAWRRAAVSGSRGLHSPVSSEYEVPLGPVRAARWCGRRPLTTSTPQFVARPTGICCNRGRAGSPCRSGAPRTSRRCAVRLGSRTTLAAIETEPWPWPNGFWLKAFWVGDAMPHTTHAYPFGRKSLAVWVNFSGALRPERLIGLSCSCSTEMEMSCRSLSRKNLQTGMRR